MPIITAMPFVKPMTIDTGMNLMNLPSLKSPMKKRIIPDPRVASIKLDSPYWAMIP